jgi:hypothetical protein
MTQLDQMVQRQPYGSPMIQNDVRDTLHAAVPGYSNRWQRQRTINGDVNRYETLDAAVQKNSIVECQ